MDKNIILLSSKDEINIKNNQSSFQNRLFQHNYLDPETSYCLTPKQISIDLQFINPACAEDDNYPAFIACPLSRIKKVWEALHGHERIKVERKFNTSNDEFHVVNGKKKSNYYQWLTWNEGEQNCQVLREINLPLEGFYTKHKFYFTRKKKYKIKDVYDEWHERESHYRSLRPDLAKEDHIIKKDANGDILFGDVKRSYTDRNVLFFHKNFIKRIGNDEFLSLNNTDREWAFDYGHLMINEEKYHYYVCNIGRSGIRLNKDHQGLDYDNPQILKIICKNVNSIISNDSFSQMIGLLSIKPELVNNQLHHTFKEQQLYQLHHTVNSVFSIELLDEKNEKLRLDEGFPTILVLGMKKMANPDINVQIHSSDNHFFDNTPTNFKVHLINSLNLNSEYKCALASITYKNDFNVDKSFDFYFVCYHIGAFGEIVTRTKFDVGKNCENAEEIFVKFEETIKGITAGTTTDETGEEKPRKLINECTFQHHNRPIYMNFNVQVVICFSYHLSRMLGVMKNYTDEEEKNEIDEEEAAANELVFNQELAKLKVQNRKNTIAKINETENPADVIIKVGSDGSGGRYSGPKPANKKYKIQQQFLFLEADFIKTLPIGSGKGKILRTISIPKNAWSGEYVTENFHNLDYHPLEYYNLKTLGFALVSLTGLQLLARDQLERRIYNETHISLIFKHFPPH